MSRWITFRQDHNNFHGRVVMFKGERVGVIYPNGVTWVVEIDQPHASKHVVDSRSETDARIEAIERVRGLFPVLDAERKGACHG